MKKLLVCLAAASLFCAACSETAKQEAKTETTDTAADGTTVKTETEVEKKTTVDK